MRPLLLALAAASAAGAAPAPRALPAVDPRVELVGVVQLLAGRRPRRAPADAEHLEAARARFSPWKEHEAVKLYRSLSGRFEGFAVDSLAMTPPPELTLDRAAAFPEPRADFEALHAALRRFAVDSRFMDFYEERRPWYAGLEQTAAADAGGTDFVGLVEQYVGSGLEARVHHVLSPLYAPERGGQSYIYPYPSPEGPAGPYDVFVILPPERFRGRLTYLGVYRGILLDELLWLYVEKTFDPSRFAGARAAECPEPECLKRALVRAAGARLAAKECAAPWCRGGAGKKPSQEVAALARRLEEYERDRARFPRLSDFYGRWLEALTD